MTGFPKTYDVIGMCRAVLEDWTKAPILADALMDANYDNHNILEILRDTDIAPFDRYECLREIVAALGVPPELEGGNWDSVFAYAGEPPQGSCDGSASIKPAIPGADISLSPFARWDVEEISGISEGENDEKNWLVYGRLKDGRWFFLTAGCDYTGWG